MAWTPPKDHPNRLGSQNSRASSHNLYNTTTSTDSGTPEFDFSVFAQYDTTPSPLPGSHSSKSSPSFSFLRRTLSEDSRSDLADIKMNHDNPDRDSSFPTFNLKNFKSLTDVISSPSPSHTPSTSPFKPNNNRLEQLRNELKRAKNERIAEELNYQQYLDATEIIKNNANNNKVTQNTSRNSLKADSKTNHLSPTDMFLTNKSNTIKALSHKILLLEDEIQALEKSIPPVPSTSLPTSNDKSSKFRKN